MNKKSEKIAKLVFCLAACTSVLAVAVICIFLFAGGLPAIKEIGVSEFLFGTVWKPKNNIYGILPMIAGSIYVTAGAILIGVPVGILTAVFLSNFCPKRFYNFIKPLTELMAGIPSVVYGFLV
jgi:ABC-type phosphate transport system, permease component